METGNAPENLMRILRELPQVDHEPARARLIRDRAVRHLARHRRSIVWTKPGASFSRIAQPVLVGALSVSFVAWIVARSIEVLQSARGGFFWP